MDEFQLFFNEPVLPSQANIVKVSSMVNQEQVAFEKASRFIKDPKNKKKNSKVLIIASSLDAQSCINRWIERDKLSLHLETITARNKGFEEKISSSYKLVIYTHMEYYLSKLPDVIAQAKQTHIVAITTQSEKLKNIINGLTLKYKSFLKIYDCTNVNNFNFNKILKAAKSFDVFKKSFERKSLYSKVNQLIVDTTLNNKFEEFIIQFLKDPLRTEFFVATLGLMKKSNNRKLSGSQIFDICDLIQKDDVTDNAYHFFKEYQQQSKTLMYITVKIFKVIENYHKNGDVNSAIRDLLNDMGKEGHAVHLEGKNLNIRDSANTYSAKNLQARTDLKVNMYNQCTSDFPLTNATLKTRISVSSGTRINNRPHSFYGSTRKISTKPKFRPLSWCKTVNTVINIGVKKL